MNDMTRTGVTVVLVRNLVGVGVKGQTQGNQEAETVVQPLSTKD